MDLHSPKNRILLKNCIVVKRKELKLAEETPEIQDELSYYFNLYLMVKSDDTENLMATLKDSTLQQKYIDFNNHVLLTPAKELAEEYLDLTQSLMQKNNAYSEADFDNLKKAFYIGNEDLIPLEKTKNSDELEEEITANPPQPYLTQEEEKYLIAMKRLFQQYRSQSISAEQLKAFSLQFRDLTLALGKSKFEQTFAKEHKKIMDMHISYEQSNSSKPVYKTDFILLDSENRQTTQSVSEPASQFIATAYSALCCSYLEANKMVRD